MNCLVCNKRAYSEYCVAHKPRKPIAVKTPLPRPTKTDKIRYGRKVELPRPSKPIKQKGKHYYKWLAVRASWVDLNMAKRWNCHYCGAEIKLSELTLDHKVPRSRAPELRYVLSNLVPCCLTCNGLKGSIDHDTYPHNCNDRIKA